MDFDQLADIEARALAALAAGREQPIVAAISGGQGAGKTTLAAKVVGALERLSVSAFACSLDDFYLTRAERADLARRVHPLLETRGVPGTHDVELLEATLASLQAGRPTAVPMFDKAVDERRPSNVWRRVEGPRVVIVEGWCLGARPQTPDALRAPVNALEANEDATGHWRSFVNTMLATSYARLNSRLDHSLFLAVPDLDAVRRWRGDQERALPAAKRMSEGELERFIAHYERLTRAMLLDVPLRADLTAVLRADHGVESLLSSVQAAFSGLPLTSSTVSR